MATYTTNYNLTKPDTTDNIDIEVLNDNFDTIDTQMQANAATALTAVTYTDGTLTQTIDSTDSEVFTADSTPTEDSTNPLTSGGAYTALADKQDTLTFDEEPTDSSTNPVTSGGVYTALSEKGDVVVTGSISLTTTWTDEGSNVYSQEVTISDVTTLSKIDLQPDSTVLAQMLTDGTTALWTVNDSATVTVYAYGAAPTVALTVQYSRTEVAS